MPVVASYESPVSAAIAAEQLRASGIAARVVASRGGGLLGEKHEVIVAERYEAERARGLLAELREDPPEPVQDLEEAVVPDLSRMDRRLAPPCPGCGLELPMDAGARACPRCGIEVDVVALIVKRHGPEILMDCYDAPNAPDEAALRKAAARCPHCSYNLAGLSSSGACPECGGGYSKAAIVAAW